MAKSLETIQTEMCSSGIGRASSIIGLLQIIAQLFSTATVSAWSATVLDWISRIENAGGTQPSDSTLNAAEDFLTYTAPFSSKLINVNLFVPDSLIASITPIIVQAGDDVYTNNGFVDGDLSVDGLYGTGTKYLETGFNPFTSGLMSSGDGGVTLYGTISPNAASIDYGGQEAAGVRAMLLYLKYTDNICYFDCWNSSTNRSGADVSGFTGYTSCNRNSTNQITYIGNFGTPFQLLIDKADAAVTPIVNIEMFIFRVNNGGVVHPFLAFKQLSFSAAHQYLTAAESEDLFDAVTTLRTALGGGIA